MLMFSYNIKKPYFSGAFLKKLKSGSVMHNFKWDPKTIPNFRKKCSNLKKTSDRRMDGRSNRPCFIIFLRLLPRI